MKCIVNAKLIVYGKIVEGKQLFFDSCITQISQGADLSGIEEIIDAKGQYVSAGFIDLHIHGSGNADVMDATAEALEIISSVLPQTGTTSFLATTMTMSAKDIVSALDNVKLHAKHVTGANILGVHLEGPFINKQKHGAQDSDYVVTPSTALIQDYMDEVKMITLAPEVEGAKAFIEHMADAHPHIILSIGHSNASYAQSKESFLWGISHVTHLFNAMNSYHHRKPGIVGATFDSDISCDVIADLLHTHPSTLELVHQVKKDKLILITDAMRAGCMKGGSYDLGGQKVEVSQGKAVLKDGTLAGSVLKMNEALYNMKTHTSMSLVELVCSVTSIPAQKLGLEKGELKVGYVADLVIFDDNFSIIQTFVSGKRKYSIKEV